MNRRDFASIEEAEKALEDALITITNLKDRDGNMLDTGSIVSTILSAHQSIIKSIREC